MDSHVAERLLLLIPGVVVLSAAGVYLLGAFAYASQFSDSGIDASNGFATLTVEQILTRGAGLILEPRTLVRIGLVTAAVAALVATRQKLGQRSDDLDATSRLDNAVPWVAYGAIAIAAIAVWPREGAPALVVLLISLAALAAGGVRQSNRALAIAVSGVLLSVAFLEYLSPEPLPVVAVTTTAQKPVIGLLVSHSADTWYVYQGGAKVIRSIPDRQVRFVLFGESEDLLRKEALETPKRLVPGLID